MAVRFVSLLAWLFQPTTAPAEAVAVRYREGESHGFLMLRTIRYHQIFRRQRALVHARGRIQDSVLIQSNGEISLAGYEDLNGVHLSGKRKVSSEVAMHLLFYRMRPDVQAICHAHPPTATGFAVAGRALDHALLPEVTIGLGQIPLVHYATPGTPEL